MIKSARGRVLLGLFIGIASLAVLIAFLQKRSGYYRSSQNPSPTTDPSKTSLTNGASPSPIASAIPSPATPSPSINPELDGATDTPTPLPETTPNPGPTAPPIGFVGKLKLIVPVAGVQPDQLQDTFADSRSEGRVHDAIDIPAPLGTPVLAAADGEILKLFESDLGGTTIYQLSTDKKLVFYYAHLHRYADGLFAAKFARQGEIIAYVGDTGNAGAGNYHLHFSIAVLSDPKRYWEGVNINPYPLLKN